jgi:sulfonate transport system substrate-binding protein
MARTLRAVVVGVALAAIAGCGASCRGSDAAAGPVTLRVGTLGTTEVLFAASGEDKNLPYRIEWSSFPAGPQLVEAQRAKAVDVGETAETPPIFAQAANTPVKVVAATKLRDPTQSPLAIVLRKDSSISGVAQLKGHKVGVTQGTVVQYFAIKALAKAGLRYADITPANLSMLDGAAALKRGDIDAMAAIDPTLAQLTGSVGAKVLVSGAGYVAGYNFQLVRTDVLADPRRSGVLLDFLRRSLRARQWANAHPEEWAAAYARANHIPLDLARVTTGRAQLEYAPIDDRTVAAQQDEADVFYRLGLLPRHLSVRDEFDARFNGHLT